MQNNSFAKLQFKIVLAKFLETLSDFLHGFKISLALSKLLKKIKFGDCFGLLFLTKRPRCTAQPPVLLNFY